MMSNQTCMNKLTQVQRQADRQASRKQANRQADGQAGRERTGHDSQYQRCLIEVAGMLIAWVQEVKRARRYSVDILRCAALHVKFNSFISLRMC